MSDQERHDQADKDDPDERERIFTRKALLQAGWAVPVALAVAPSVAHAASGIHADHQDHADVGSHVDAS